jgi:hypothetical protein
MNRLTHAAEKGLAIYSRTNHHASQSTEHFAELGCFWLRLATAAIRTENDERGLLC